MEQQSLSAGHLPAPSLQRGAILLFALIMLVVLTIAAVALVRSVDTANLLTGNLAFKQTTIQLADVGVEAATSNLATILASSSDDKFPAGCSNECIYYPTGFTNEDAKGVPTSITWSSVPTVTGLALPSGYSVQYVIDRLCEGPAPATDIVGECFSEGSLSGGSKKAGAAKFTAAATIYYRVTIRVAGPRATETYVQAILNR